MSSTRTSGGRLEEREVRAADPQLSEHTNARLTEELRAAVGQERVKVPVDRPHATDSDTAEQGRGLAASLNFNRLLGLIMVAIAIVIAAIISVRLNEWWILPIAIGVLAVLTVVVASGVLRLTRLTEHPSPSLAAAMSAEGIANPDQRFSEMVQEFASPDGTEGGSWDAVRKRTGQDDHPTSSLEQSASMTSGSQPTDPHPTEGATNLLIGGIATGFIVVSLLLPIIGGGGAMWILPAVVIPITLIVLGLIVMSARRKTLSVSH